MAVMSDPYAALYPELARVALEDCPALTVEPVAPLSLQDGEARLRTALTDGDWLTAMALAKRLAQTDGWGDLLAACVRQEDSVWGSVGAAIMARLTQETADVAEIERLEAAIQAAPTREERLPLVVQQEQLRVVVGFLAYCGQRTEAAMVAQGTADDLPLHLLCLIGQEAMLHNPELRACALATGAFLTRTLTPDHLAPLPNEPR